MCLSVSLSVSLPACQSLSVCLSLYLYIYLIWPMCLSVSLSVSLPACQSLLVCLSLYLYILFDLCVYLSVCLSLYLYIYLPCNSQPNDKEEKFISQSLFALVCVYCLQLCLTHLSAKENAFCTLQSVTHVTDRSHCGKENRVSVSGQTQHVT